MLYLEEIVGGLENLFGGMTFHGLTGKLDALTKGPGGLLWACWLGRPIMLQKILMTGVSPNITDHLGR